MKLSMVISLTGLLAACASSTNADQAARSGKPISAAFEERALRGAMQRKWTDRFEAGGVLVADQIRVEGPPDLLQHFGLTQDLDLFTYTTRTIPEGLLQTMTRRQGAPELGQIQGQLDGWTLAAIFRLEVLQRPDDGPVRIFARGQAAWLPHEGEAQRADRLDFIGEHVASE